MEETEIMLDTQSVLKIDLMSTAVQGKVEGKKNRVPPPASLASKHHKHQWQETSGGGQTLAKIENAGSNL